jgi:hypothetical protein
MTITASFHPRIELLGIDYFDWVMLVACGSFLWFGFLLWRGRTRKWDLMILQFVPGLCMLVGPPMLRMIEMMRSPDQVFLLSSKEVAGNFILVVIGTFLQFGAAFLVGRRLVCKPPQIVVTCENDTGSGDNSHRG